MDYVVGSVAALISGNVTPNRPKILKRALTPMKHQPSPNVTPKSESVTDRSIFLSPTMQKKKAIVKKSPKRIFQNPDLDLTSENDGHTSVSSPKADKVKKHLEDELNADKDTVRSILSPKSPKNTKNKSVPTPSKMQLNISADNPVPEEIQFNNESTPKKNKKKLSVVSELIMDDKLNEHNANQVSNMEFKTSIEKTTPRKKRKSNTFTVEIIDNGDAQTTEPVLESAKNTEIDEVDKKVKKKKNKLNNIDIKNIDSNLEIDENTSVHKLNEDQIKTKKNKNHKKKASKNVQTNLEKQNTADESMETVNENNTDYINPNAITNQDTDSEHESDDDIQSENEESNKAVLDTGPQESSDDEEETENKQTKNKSNKENVVKHHVDTEEVKRTLFVGNVPFSSKCKKEIKRIFGKYGEIETVRIRTVPVKDGRVTPKLAVIKNELHPDRSTINVYIKYVHPSSVNDALVENNTVLNDHHLRVARSDVTGSEHDPRCSVFVGNIPFALEDDALRATFDKCGDIESVRIVRDRKTNAGKGFGYVNFKSKDGVELALALTEEDLTIKNRILRVKRCTQPTTKQQERQQNNQGRPQSYQARQQGIQGRQQSYQGRQQGYQGRQQSYQGRQQGYQGRQQNYQGRQQNYQGRPQMDRSGRSQFGNDRFQRKDQSTDSKGEGAYRRIMKKRKPQEDSEGPPQKRRNLNQPDKEKKPRKEFVGITADKRKFQKRKLTKDQQKKRAISEILTKQRQ